MEALTELDPMLVHYLRQNPGREGARIAEMHLAQARTESRSDLADAQRALADALEASRFRPGAARAVRFAQARVARAEATCQTIDAEYARVVAELFVRDTDAA